jgi:hypothetical protein
MVYDFKCTKCGDRESSQSPRITERGPICSDCTVETPERVMTVSQAVSILEAERVLQHVGCDGPDCAEGGAWHNYVSEAVAAIADDSLFCNEFDDCGLVAEIKSKKII